MLASFARKAGGKLAVAATTAGVVASQPAAQARAPPPPTQRLFGPTGPSISAAKEDLWLLPQLQNDEVFFKDEELQEGVDELRAIVLRSSKVQDVHAALESDGSTTDGEDANDAIEFADGHADLIAPRQLDLVLGVATELIRRPHIQREVLDIIGTNPELKSLLQSNARGGPMQLFLTAPGVAPAATITEVTDEEPAAEEDGAAPEARDGSSRLLLAVADALKAAAGQVGRLGTAMGDALGRLGSWMKRMVLRGGKQQTTQDGQAGEPGSGPSVGEQVVGAVTVLAVAILMIVVLKRPAMLARVTVAGAAAAAAKRKASSHTL